jgi:hypothetical protein
MPAFFAQGVAEKFGAEHEVRRREDARADVRRGVTGAGPGVGEPVSGERAGARDEAATDLGAAVDGARSTGA